MMFNGVIYLVACRYDLQESSDDTKVSKKVGERDSM